MSPWPPHCFYMKSLGKDMLLYFDNPLLALNKSAGMLTQPNETTAPSLESFGKAWVKNHFKKPGDVFLEALHRLDKPVSGVVLFARTSKALSRLNGFIREGLFHKEYLAIVQGEFQEAFQEEGVLEHYLRHDAFCARLASAKSAGAKKCLLKYCVLNYVNGHTLLKISLITGRYHQIRAQLAAVGYPILGDTKYGCSHFSGPLCLHHRSLSFPHPISQ